MKNFQIKKRALLYTALFQLIFIIIVFFGGLLDPLLGMIAVAINFLTFNSFFIYKYFSQRNIS